MAAALQQDIEDGGRSEEEGPSLGRRRGARILVRPAEVDGNVNIFRRAWQAANRLLQVVGLASGSGNARDPRVIDYYAQSRKWHKRRAAMTLAGRWRMVKQETQVLALVGREDAAKRAEAASPGTNGARMSVFTRVMLGSRFKIIDPS